MDTTQKTNWEIEKLLLETKVFDGARALDDYFGHMASRDYDPVRCAEQAAEKYLLTPNQRDFLTKVAVRAQRAVGIVRHLENRFGVNDNHEFKDPQGLHRLIYGGTYVPKKLNAHANNFGIGFEKERWVYDETMGYYRCSKFDQLSVPLEQTIEQLEKGKRTNCAMLAYCYPSLDACDRKINTKKWDSPRGLEYMMFVIFDSKTKKPEAEILQERIKVHEKRHIIDNIISGEYVVNKAEQIFNETPAYLYDSCSSQGLEDDLSITDFANRQIKNHQVKLKTLYKLNAPQQLIQREQGEIRQAIEWAEHITAVKKSTYDIIRKIFKQKHDASFYDALSYIFSTMRPEKVPKYLGLVAAQQ